MVRAGISPLWMPPVTMLFQRVRCRVAVAPYVPSIRRRATNAFLDTQSGTIATTLCAFNVNRIATAGAVEIPHQAGLTVTTALTEQNGDYESRKRVVREKPTLANCLQRQCARRQNAYPHYHQRAFCLRCRSRQRTHVIEPHLKKTCRKIIPARRRWEFRAPYLRNCTKPENPATHWWVNRVG